MISRLALLAVFCTFLHVSESRVKFTHSSLYDEYDFIGKNRIVIDECSSVKQCAIFVSLSKDAKYKEIYDNIMMAPEARVWSFTLSQFAAMRNETTKAINPYFITDGAVNPSAPTYFYNDNKNQVAAPLVIYAVNLDNEPNWSNTQAVYDAADVSNIFMGKISTILSATPFNTVILGDENTIATVFATGFDNADVNDNNVDNCRRVLQTRFDDVVTFQINGPIASIYFSDFKGKLTDTKSLFSTTFPYKYDPSLNAHGFITSQGYVGCKDGQVYRSSLYSSTVQYNLFAQESHFVQQTIYLKTDNERPLNVQYDGMLENFIGTDLLTAQTECTQTHQLLATFNQSNTNSFAILYNWGNYDCNEVTIPQGVTATTRQGQTSDKATSPSAVSPTTSLSGDLRNIFMCGLIAAIRLWQ